MLVRLRWPIVGPWAVLAAVSVLWLPPLPETDSDLKGFASDTNPAVQVEQRSFELFGFPLSSRTSIVQRDPDGLSLYAQAEAVLRAAALSRGDYDSRLLGALPVPNTFGAFPGSRERGTTVVTYVFGDPTATASARSAGTIRSYEEIRAATTYCSAGAAGRRGDRRGLRDLGRPVSADHGRVHRRSFAVEGGSSSAGADPRVRGGGADRRPSACCAASTGSICSSGSALVAVLALTTLLGGALLDRRRTQRCSTRGCELPPVPDVGVGRMLLVLGGIVITVQGFETVRYLGDEYDAADADMGVARGPGRGGVDLHRHRGGRDAVMGLGTAAGADDTLLQVTDRVAPILALPLVLCAVLSQFSAAIADTVAADGNLRGLARWMRGSRPYLVTRRRRDRARRDGPDVHDHRRRLARLRRLLRDPGADRAAHLRRYGRRVGYGALAVVMTAITLLAEPAG